jgi:hypothetical protein
MIARIYPAERGKIIEENFSASSARRGNETLAQARKREGKTNIHE